MTDPICPEKFETSLIFAHNYQNHKIRFITQMNASISDSGSTLGKFPGTILVNPQDIGPVHDLNPNDVLCGRGARVNRHSGNIQFRRICGEKRDEYLRKNTRNVEKNGIASGVVMQIRSMHPPGRFLKQDPTTNEWFDIGCEAAMVRYGCSSMYPCFS